MKQIGKERLNLPLTLMDSAQCFRWQEAGGRFGAVLRGKTVWLWQDGDGIWAETALETAFLRQYLDLDRDYGALATEYACYPQAQKAIADYPGMRVLRQDVWEALISFILSANNNVTRIRSLVEKLSCSFGTAYETPWGTLHDFPTPARLARCNPEQLRALGVGYRDRYLVETARAVEAGFPMEELRTMPYEEAHERLITLPGVGDKVADCVQLFGCGHTQAFPVDVWVARMAAQVFGLKTANRKKLARECRALLGQDAGLLQQYLFHAARMGTLETCPPYTES